MPTLISLASESLWSGSFPDLFFKNGGSSGGSAGDLRVCAGAMAGAMGDGLPAHVGRVPSTGGSGPHRAAHTGT